MALSTDKIFSGILQTVIAAGIVWMATEINKLDARLAGMEEKTKALDDVRPTMNQMQLSQEEIKERLIRVEDNQHHKIPQSN